MASPQELLDRLELFGTRLGLANTRDLLGRLGAPQGEMAVVLVAGTNGKGSTAALLAAIATAAGYRTGLYTSPHLETVHERIRVDGVSISERELSTCLDRVVSAARTEVTYFEAITCTALLSFARQEVELAVLEVGLGGRLDATNATEPILSVISEIALDHREHLGGTLAEIAAEKAGIFRAATPAVAWVSDAAARRVLEQRAAELGVPLRLALDDSSIAPGEDEDRVTLSTPGAKYRLTRALNGAFQLSNLALAVAAAEALGSAGWKRIGSAAVRAGIAACRWPGRLEWVDLGPTGRLLLDGAHNPHAAAALASHLATLEPGYTLIFGALEGKQVDAMLPPLAERAGRVILTAPETSRAIDPRRLAGALPERETETVARAPDALERALGSAATIVVCGSLYLVGDLRRELYRRFGRPTPAGELPTYRAS